MKTMEINGLKKCFEVLKIELEEEKCIN